MCLVKMFKFPVIMVISRIGLGSSGTISDDARLGGGARVAVATAAAAAAVANADALSANCVEAS